MAVVPAGSYSMGSPESEEGREDGEGPRHEVRIDKEFAVGIYAVTFAEWDACAAQGGCGGYKPSDGTAWETQNIVERMQERRHGGRRVLRGGSWSNDPAGLRSAARAKLVAGFRGVSGFRVARGLSSGVKA